MCLPLTSRSRVAAKTSGETDAVPVRVVRTVSQDLPLEIPPLAMSKRFNSVEVKPRREFAGTYSFWKSIPRTDTENPNP